MKTSDKSGAGASERNVDEDRMIGELWSALQDVADPELHAGIVDLGLVHGVGVSGGKAVIRMTLTSPACPYGPYLLRQVKTAAKAVSGVQDVHVDLVWDPPWSPALMTEDLRIDMGFDV